MEIKEFEVPVPWGHIAVKTWGNEANEPIILIHGGRDNAGTFDKLIPLLPTSFYYICWDLPSHGKSSHYPEHFPIYCTNTILAVKLVAKHFGRESYILLGHSFGAAFARMYAVLYPSNVKKLVLIEGMVCFFVEPKDIRAMLLKCLEHSLKVSESGGKRPWIMYEQAVEILRKSRLGGGALSVEEVKPLMDRALKPVGNGKFVFREDRRLSAAVFPLHDLPYVTEMFRLYPSMCLTLIILAKNSAPPVLAQHPLLKEVKEWKDASIQFVEGDHDVHLKHPERVAEAINRFLLNSRNKL